MMFFKEIKRLKARKVTQITDIPVKVLKENADIFSAYLCDFLNESIKDDKFPVILKNGDIKAVFKKDFKRSTENYRPVSILPIFSKKLEKIISKQTNFIYKLYILSLLSILLPITIKIPKGVSKKF